MSSVPTKSTPHALLACGGTEEGCSYLENPQIDIYGYTHDKPRRVSNIPELVIRPTIHRDMTGEVVELDD